MTIREATAFCFIISSICHADVYRWDNSALIPGTEGVRLGPAVDLSFAQLEYANLAGYELTGANFQGSNLRNAAFIDCTNGIIPEDRCHLSNLAGADFSNADLSGADLWEVDLSRASFVGANLSGAELTLAELSEADFGNATITNASLGWNMTKDQIYATLSYRNRNLQGIDFALSNLSNWDLSGQDLRNTNYRTDWCFLSHRRNVFCNVDGTVRSDISGTVFLAADLRGSSLSFIDPSAVTRNAIRSDGTINGLHLRSGETLLIRDDNFIHRDPIDIHVNSEFKIEGGVLEVILEDADWGSTIHLSEVSPSHIDGTLRITIANSADMEAMAGSTHQLFRWELEDGSNSLSRVEVPEGTRWDLTKLANTGEVIFIGRAGVGDANSDGVFNSLDLVDVFTSGEFEDAIEDNSTWSEGDWNGDLDFDSSDFIAAFVEGSYVELAGPAAAVPEPQTSMLLLGLLAFMKKFPNGSETGRARRSN